MQNSSKDGQALNGADFAIRCGNWVFNSIESDISRVEKVNLDLGVMVKWVTLVVLWWHSWEEKEKREKKRIYIWQNQQNSYKSVHSFINIKNVSIFLIKHNTGVPISSFSLMQGPLRCFLWTETLNKKWGKIEEYISKHGKERHTFCFFFFLFPLGFGTNFCWE